MKQILKNKRGVTPVLSNVLLTVIAVAAMSLAASATYIITENLHQIMGERAIAEDIWFTTDGISIYLANIGKVAIETSSVYVNSTSQPFIPILLDVGEHGWLNISFSWSSNGLYYLAIITSRGTEIANYYQAPS
ncbi:MAG: hypothetical protein JSV05_06975 [Candidatus Bathyarchaeota archaeon]|nr:MAG: hypothetical protein JSV05_06975 [Candidatus Bathyarchaeota archaeon]